MSNIERCEHTDDPTHDGQWCGYCNPAFGGDSGGDVDLGEQLAVAETEIRQLERQLAGGVEALTEAREALKDAHRPGHWHGVLKARSILSDALDRVGGQ